ncbi:MAG: hypothetical protein K9K67_11445 [Bacteriovoracaceae bacterium]|nr:hypothetical protein [Bacteriovoracaceae bacterium]
MANSTFKNSIRRPSLDEWFLIYQLKKIKQQFHIPIYVDVDVTRLANHYQELGVPAPYTLLLIKAASLLIHEEPLVNKAVFHTFYGLRVVEFPYNSVNVPITMIRENKKVVSATKVIDAYNLTNLEIRKELKKATKKSLDELPINKIIHTKKNNIFNRSKLKLIHFLMMNFPILYLRNQAGGISVSSIPHQYDPDSPIQGMSFGMTGVTLFSSSMKKEEEKTYLRLGIGFDHMICHGDVAMKASTTLCHILSAKSSEHFDILTR